MRGLYGKKDFQIELRERADVAVTGHFVRLRVLACGVCGTDLHFLRDMEDRTPMGHEIAAEVMETGGDVTRVRVGDTVICEDSTQCGTCLMCKTGRSGLCRNTLTLGEQPGMSDEIVVHENMLNIYKGIDPVTACMTEPLAVAIRGINKLSVRPMENIAIFGMGAIGLFSCAYARMRGAGKIIMVAHNHASLRNRAAAAAAFELGADDVCYSDNPDYIAKLRAAASFDAAIVAAPPALCKDAIDLVDYGGNVLAMGVTFGKNGFANLNVSDMVFNKKQLLTSIAEPAVNFPLSIELIASGRIRADRIITHTLPIDEAGKLRDLYAEDSTAIKTVILPNG